MWSLRPIILAILASTINARSMPAQILGANVGDLKAGLNTNIFSKLKEGANALMGITEAPQDSNKDTKDSSNHKLIGVNVLGLKAGIDTNLFDKDGPLAKMGEGFKELNEKSKNFFEKVGQDNAAFWNKVKTNLKNPADDSGSSLQVSFNTQGKSGGSLPMTIPFNPMAPNPMAPNPMAPYPMAPYPMAPNPMAPIQWPPILWPQSYGPQSNGPLSNGPQSNGSQSIISRILGIRWGHGTISSIFGTTASLRRLS
ncbi:hypothetical protein HHI36_022133 [Cryptolaemus montrouzieri]|uniref:Uncharacterized protein n=1 Tax=Cryptolaemus montrouzieri TaxID=559131 RepID=A0ABD2MZ62_9CUCU